MKDTKALKAMKACTLPLRPGVTGRRICILPDERAT
jgi:hypothetical protein